MCHQQNIVPRKHKCFLMNFTFLSPIIDMAREWWAVQWRGRHLWLGYKDVASKRQWEMPLVRCFYTAEADQQELVLSSSILWLKGPYLSFSNLSCRLQWSSLGLLGRTLLLLPPSALTVACLNLLAQTS